MSSLNRLQTNRVLPSGDTTGDIAVWPAGNFEITRPFATSTTQTWLSGPAHVTSSVQPPAPSASPLGEAGIAMDCVTRRAPTSNTSTRSPVAQAM